MQLDKNNIEYRIRKAFALHDEIAKVEAIKELLDLIDSGEAKMEDGIDELITGIEQESKSSVLSFVWAKLATMKPDEKIKSLAERELESPSADHRRFALAYLTSVYLEDGRALYERMRMDNDATVLFEAGKAILPIEPKLALGLWFSIIGISPHVLGDEIIPEYIAQYADEDFISYLTQYHEEEPDDRMVEMILGMIEQRSF